VTVRSSSERWSFSYASIVLPMFPTMRRTSSTSILADLSPRVLAVLQDTQDLKIEGAALIQRLEALKNTYRLNSPDPDDANPDLTPQIIRIVCSDGLT
jgi:hypothetical protein